MTALITGASSGIGLELAKIHAEKGGNLIVVARNIQKLKEIKLEFESKYAISVEVIGKDLAAPNAAQELFDEVRAKNIEVDYLINNAGFGQSGAFADCDWTKTEGMLAVNINALTELTKLFLPAMIARKKGKVLNVASVGAYLPGPYMAAYFATKAYVLSLSKALSIELRGSGVSVTAVCPGPTASQFWESSGTSDTSLVNRIQLPSAKDVATKGYRAMIKGKSSVIPGWWNKLLVGFIRIIPKMWSAKATGRFMKQ